MMSLADQDGCEVSVIAIVYAIGRDVLPAGCVSIEMDFHVDVSLCQQRATPLHVSDVWVSTCITLPTSAEVCGDQIAIQLEWRRCLWVVDCCVLESRSGPMYIIEDSCKGEKILPYHDDLTIAVLSTWNKAQAGSVDRMKQVSEHRSKAPIEMPRKFEVY